MDHRPVLDVGPVADSDRIDVAAQDGVEPDRTVAADGHVADQHGRFGHERPFTHTRRMPPYLFYICHIDSSFSYCGCGNTPHPLSCKNRNSAREFQLFGRRSGEKSFGLNPSRTSARFAAAGRHSTSRSGSQSAAWEGGGYTKQGHLPANPRFFPFPPPIVLHIFNSALRKMRINLLLRPTFPIFARRNSARERGDGMWKDLTDCKPQ